MMFDTPLFRDGKYQGIYRLIHLSLRYAERFPIWGVLFSPNSFGGKNWLVQENNAVMIFLKISDLLFELNSPSLILLFLLWVDKLDKLYFLAFDFVFLIKLTEECRVDTMAAKVSMEH